MYARDKLLREAERPSGYGIGIGIKIAMRDLQIQARAMLGQATRPMKPWYDLACKC